MSANTLRPIELDLAQFTSITDYEEFRTKLLLKLAEIKNQRFDWYDGQRRARARWVHGSRRFLAVIGSIAILLTAAAATVRITNWWPELDIGALVVALVLYAVMGAVSFFERTTDSTTAYFRHLGVVLAIRDLWTKLQFEFLKDVVTARGADAAARERLCTLAEAFCRDLDKLASVELTEWRTEFVASQSELEAASAKGGEDVQKQLSDSVKALQKASADALKAAEEAARPAYVNVKLTGSYEKPATILVDDKEIAVTPLATYPIMVRPGLRKIEARAKKNGAEVQAAEVREVKAGVQPMELSLG